MDATHIKLGISDLDEDMAEEMERIISRVRGKLRIGIGKK